MLNSQDIRFATGKQLANLFGTSEAIISAWTSGRYQISGRLLERAAAKGIPKNVLLGGLDKRRKDYSRARSAQRNIDEFLNEEIASGVA